VREYCEHDITKGTCNICYESLKRANSNLSDEASHYLSNWKNMMRDNERARDIQLAQLNEIESLKHANEVLRGALKQVSIQPTEDEYTAEYGLGFRECDVVEAYEHMIKIAREALSSGGKDESGR